MSNLERIRPKSTQKMAKAAANGSLRDLRCLYLRTLGQSQREAEILFLPIVYALLDPKRIPEPNTIEKPAETKELVGISIVALETLQAVIHPHKTDAITVPLTAGPDLWPRFWAWTQFIDTTRDLLIGLDVPSDQDVLTSLMAYVAYFQGDQETLALINTAQGFHSMLVREWTYLLNNWEAEIPQIGLIPVVDFLSKVARLVQPSREKTDKFVADLSKGAGGVEPFATLVTRNLDLAVNAGDSKDENWSINWCIINGVLDFLVIVEDAMDENGEDDIIGFLFEQLLVQGLIKLLVDVVGKFIGITDLDPGVTLNRSFHILWRLMRFRNMHHLLGDALGHGLLRCIVRCGQRPALVKSNPYLKTFLTRFLPAATVYCGALRGIQQALFDVKELVCTAAFQSSEIFFDWTQFVSIAESRIKLLNSFDGRKERSMKACDNLACNKIEEKNKFRRCSGCMNCYYCSPECQRSDWKVGGHRAACVTCRPFYPSEHHSSTSRERAFMRFLMHQKYSQEKREVLRDTVLCLGTNPTAGCFTVFDFLGMSASPTKVYSMADSADSKLHKQLRQRPGWAHIVARAACSKGRMSVHLMRVGEGIFQRYWVIPLRTCDSIVHDTLKSIAVTLPLPEDDGEVVSPDLVDLGPLCERSFMGFKEIH
ncbi:hypothetical protein C8R43DRAFT_1128749 [Mycena crocata]|nr:hypothetical protein C8R43DRAFT_1128749 [Mycena crocata]